MTGLRCVLLCAVSLTCLTLGCEAGLERISGQPPKPRDEDMAMPPKDGCKPVVKVREPLVIPFGSNLGLLTGQSCATLVPPWLPANNRMPLPTNQAPCLKFEGNCNSPNFAGFTASLSVDPGVVPKEDIVRASVHFSQAIGHSLADYNKITGRQALRSGGNYLHKLPSVDYPNDFSYFRIDNQGSARDSNVVGPQRQMLEIAPQDLKRNGDRFEPLTMELAARCEYKDSDADFFWLLWDPVLRLEFAPQAECEK